MRELTFVGYLTEYVRKLSSGNTNSIYKLADEATHNHRLRAPLALYALCINKTNRLIAATKDSELKSHYNSVFATLNAVNVESLLANKSSGLTEEYYKVWEAYQCRINKVKIDGRVKLRALEKVRTLQAEKGISNYRIYTDLNLNAGNINTWLKNGDVNKISVDTAVKVLQYLRGDLVTQ